MTEPTLAKDRARAEDGTRSQGSGDRIRSKVGAAALVLLAVAAGCTRPGTPSGNSFVIAGCEPADLIPQQQTLDCEGQYFEVLFTGLVEEDPAGKVNLALAQSITSDDQITWTIKLHDGWTFHNGEPVTAYSFVQTWNAAVQYHSHASGFFSEIEGYEDVNSAGGKQPTAKTMSGLTVLDRLTFQVKLVAPHPKYGADLIYDAYDPLPPAFFRDLQDGDLRHWLRKPIGDGPYEFAEPWKHKEAIDLKRYPGYQGTPGLADRIEFRIEPDPFPDLERGLIDISTVSAPDFPAARKEFRGRLVERPNSTSIAILALPLFEPRFQNRDLRQALSLAIDRAAIVNAVYGGLYIPATSLFPTEVDGHDDACSFCLFDVSAARQKLAASGWKGTLNLFTSDAGVSLEATRAVAEQLRRNLGIDVTVHPLRGDVLGQRETSGDLPGPWYEGWDLGLGAREYLRIYKTNDEYNESGYSNPEVDRLIAAGDAATSPSEGITDFQRAESLVLEDMPVIPLWYPRQFIAYSKRIASVPYIGDYIALERVRVVG